MLGDARRRSSGHHRRALRQPAAHRSARELERQLKALAPRAALLPRRLPDRSLADTVAMLRKAAGAEGIAIIVVGLATSDRSVAREVDADAFLQVPFEQNAPLRFLPHEAPRHRLPDEQFASTVQAPKH